ncbi:DUF21 domain-containing protein [Alginatibacterium sediminis]|uniref:DUF21 domain-containing protein n=1 Tax=Alginatibacterium sediminis TaxID=2164068 RepID=A0A420EB59_9ALTE|nr:CNNM domain-containing protein [Alginatibacterium sediminis]RKF17916.1 DUF21 domain-containing protein [Alginatibacterium sediminis]
MTLLLIYIFVAIGVSFICSILEAVLLSITPSYIEVVRKNKPLASKQLIHAKENLEQSISSILILNTFSHTMGAAGVGAQAMHLFGAKWESLVAFLLTLAILYFSEIIPKTLGAKYWKSLAIPATRLIAVLVKLVYPLVLLSSYITRLFGASKLEKVTREEIQAITYLGGKHGSINQKEVTLIENIIRLREYTTEQILTPRTVVCGFEKDEKIAEILTQERSSGFTRFPVFDETIDKVIGFVTHRMMTDAFLKSESTISVGELAQPIHRVSNQLPVLSLIDLFVAQKEHLFLVEDSFGQTAGIVSLEDAIETLLGCEIVDETDQTEDMQLLAKQRFRDRIRFNKKNPKTN